MVRSELTVLEGGLERGRRPRRGAATAIFVAIAAAAIVAGLRGAGRARVSLDARALGAKGERAAVGSGPEAPEVRAVLRELRAHLGERPLDAAARLAYAGVLREAAAGVDGIDAAVFHAERAAATAPVTAGFAGTAARILARSGRPDRAGEIARGIFSWAPWAAAELLRDIEPFLGDGAAARIVPPEAAARRAWIVTLRNLGRNAEANAALDQALRDAPDDPVLIEMAAWAAIAARDFARLDALIPDGPIPARAAGGGGFLALRALGKAYRGDRTAAIDDARAAAQRAVGNPGILINAGDALALAGDLGGARDVWQRARFELPPGDRSHGRRLDVSVRLARLEERDGRAGDALRAWREVLALDPAHPEALQRREALSGER